MSTLKLRREPRQARSRATFESILRVAAELLEQDGWEGFNTNLLAERAGLGPQALYRYFPNKIAVVATIAERMVEEWDTWFKSIDEALGEGDSIEQVWGDYIDDFVVGIRSLPGGLAVRRAMSATPELREIDQLDNTRLADRLGAALTRCDSNLPLEDACAVARMLIESAVPVIDLALMSAPTESERLLRELKDMQITYLTKRVKFVRREIYDDDEL